MSRFVIKALNTTTCGVLPVRFANTPPKYKKKKCQEFERKIDFNEKLMD
jgi:hypothetical protein